MDRERLRAFLASAHRNGYASNDATVVDETGEKAVEYREGDWSYRDRYHGSRAFVGREIVSHDGSAVWGMHYHGTPIDGSVDHGRLYEFLREALAAVTPEYPHRGPETYRGDSFDYAAAVEGTVAEFSGTETISADGDVVYRGRFGGCSIE